MAGKTTSKKPEVDSTKEDIFTGTFGASLIRGNKEIKKDRAEGIIEDASLRYERTIQDMVMERKTLVRKRNNMLDLSPTNSDSLMLGEEFNSIKFIADDIKIGVELRNLDIKLEIATSRFKELFGRSIATV